MVFDSSTTGSDIVTRDSSEGGKGVWEREEERRRG